MIKLNDKKLYVSICCLLVILLVVGIVCWVNKTNNKPVKHNTSKNNNKEKFSNSLDQYMGGLNSEINNNSPDKKNHDSSTLTTDELLDQFQSGIDGTLEVVSLVNLSTTITKIFNEKIGYFISNFTTEMDTIKEDLNKMNIKIDNFSKKEPIPKGSIMLWYKKDMPNKNWVLCDGSTYNVVYKDGTKENGVEVPNFVGKFVKGVDDKATNFNSGGSDIISADNLPVHSHIVNSKSEFTTSMDGKHDHEIRRDRMKHGSFNNDYTYDNIGGVKSNSTYNNVATGVGWSKTHSHTIPEHNHTIQSSINYRTNNNGQDKFEPTHQEAKFIYYLGYLSSDPIKQS